LNLIFYTEISSSEAEDGSIRKLAREIFENVSNVQKYGGLGLSTVLLQAEASADDPPLASVSFQIEEAVDISIPLQLHTEANDDYRLAMSFELSAWIEVGKSGIRGSLVGREQLFKEQTLKTWTRIFVSILEDIAGTKASIKP